MSIWYANARNHSYICGEAQTNYDLNEGIKIKKHKVKARFRLELNEISPFFQTHLRMDFLTRVFQCSVYIREAYGCNCSVILPFSIRIQRFASFCASSIRCVTKMIGMLHSSCIRNSSD